MLCFYVFIFVNAAGHWTKSVLVLSCVNRHCCASEQVSMWCPLLINNACRRGAEGFLHLEGELADSVWISPDESCSSSLVFHVWQTEEGSGYLIIQKSSRTLSCHSIRSIIAQRPEPKYFPSLIEGSLLVICQPKSRKTCPPTFPSLLFRPFLRKRNDLSVYGAFTIQCSKKQSALLFSEGHNRESGRVCSKLLGGENCGPPLHFTAAGRGRDWKNEREGKGFPFCFPAISRRKSKDARVLFGLASHLVPLLKTSHSIPLAAGETDSPEYNRMTNHECNA